MNPIDAANILGPYLAGGLVLLVVSAAAFMLGMAIAERSGR